MPSGYWQLQFILTASALRGRARTTGESPDIPCIVGEGQDFLLWQCYIAAGAFIHLEKHPEFSGLKACPEGLFLSILTPLPRSTKERTILGVQAFTECRKALEPSVSAWSLTQTQNERACEGVWIERESYNQPPGPTLEFVIEAFALHVWSLGQVQQNARREEKPDQRPVSPAQSGEVQQAIIASGLQLRVSQSLLEMTQVVRSER
ncbi:hypothetical protein RRG08_041716 [Elysia crispata]|uniref:Uncharacterized protein n=1 Tax=Elysia crispata TaxID=231223 RepID=A0AAE0YZ62_9GAST|nr:hypothetical protein RRG08_041716 [Elysia crispata]